MRRCLLLLAMLGVRAWAFEVTYTVLRTHMQHLPAALLIAWIAAFAKIGVPILALAVGSMAVLYARRRHTSQWAVAFAILAAIAVVLCAIGLSLDRLPVSSYAPAQEVARNVATYTQLLFPVFVFVPALIYAVRFGPAGRGAGGALTRRAMRLLRFAVPLRARIRREEERRSAMPCAPRPSPGLRTILPTVTQDDLYGLEPSYTSMLLASFLAHDKEPARTNLPNRVTTDYHKVPG